jgi:para-nitrobenzyl esterase
MEMRRRAVRQGPGFVHAMLRAPFGVVVLLLLSCAGTRTPGTVAAPGAWTGSPVVTTRFGAVRGAEAPDNTLVWKAIPYAKPPVGDLRWRAPQDPDPWAGVREAGSFSGGCTQFSAIFQGSIVGSEDCLYLNVWRPNDTTEQLPVYVWIHGGGNSIGSATMVPDYFGNRLASRSRMVFVSLNYRLGPFGWFTHPAFRDAGDPGITAEDASGNFGTLDIIQALKWVRQNIGAFGGDPGDVTVTGESAGGFNVLSLLISPPAAGLFQRAMSESGSAATRGVDEADATSRGVLNQLLVISGKARTPEQAGAVAEAMSPAAIRAFLRSLSDRQILRCYSRVSLAMIDNPSLIRDGTVLPSDGFDSLSNGTYPGKVPLILGSNKEELKLFLAFTGTPPWRSDLYAAVVKYGSDRWKASGVDEVARRASAHADQPPIYAYQFSWGAPDAKGHSTMPGNWGRRLGAFHSLEIPFFLGTDTLEGVLQGLLFTRANEPGRKALSAAMMDYVAQFARTGDPNRQNSGLPEWKPWTNAAGEEKLMILDANNTSTMLRMSTTELTDEGVLDAARTELAEPLRDQVLSALEKSKMPAGVR